LVFLLLWVEPFELVTLLVVCVRDELRWLRPGWLGSGAELLLEVVVLEDGPELELDPVELEVDESELLGAELELEVVVPLLLVVVPLLLVVVPLLLVVVDDDVTGAHDSLSDTTTPLTGRFMAEIGVPGATFTLNV
jgi:hypothetical protein